MAELTEEQVKEIVEAARLITQELKVTIRVDDTVNIKADAGTNDLVWSQLERGRILVLEHISGYDDTSSPTRIRVGYWNGHRYNWLKTQPAPIASETVGHSGRVYLRDGMYPIVRVEGATSGDDLFAIINGYWIKE